MRTPFPSRSIPRYSVLQSVSWPPDSKLHLAWVAVQADDLESAEGQFLSLLESRKEKLGDDHRDTAIARMGLVAVYVQSERYVDAMFHRVWQIFRERLR